MTPDDVVNPNVGCPHPSTRMHVRKPGGVLIRKEICEVCGTVL